MTRDTIASAATRTELFERLSALPVTFSGSNQTCSHLSGNLNTESSKTSLVSHPSGGLTDVMYLSDSAHTLVIGAGSMAGVSPGSPYRRP